MAKNQHTPKEKSFKKSYEDVGSSKIGHDFRKLSGSKIESRKKNVFTKKWSHKLIFLKNKKMF